MMTVLLTLGWFGVVIGSVICSEVVLKKLGLYE